MILERWICSEMVLRFPGMNLRDALRLTHCSIPLFNIVVRRYLEYFLVVIDNNVVFISLSYVICYLE